MANMQIEERAPERAKERGAIHRRRDTERAEEARVFCTSRGVWTRLVGGVDKQVC